MALRFCDSFDHYVTADVLSKWTSGNQIAQVTIEAGTGRFGQDVLYLVSTNAPNVVKTLDSQATWIVGFAYKTSNNVTQTFFALLDGGSRQLELRLNSSGSLQVTRNGTLLATGTQVLTASVWYYIELKATIANSGGTAVVRVNGVQDISFTGDTQETANATANQIQLWNDGLYQQRYCDLYVCDGTGSAPTNDYLGDVRVEAIFPSGNGNSSQLDGSDGNQTDNYLLVDEAAPNSDTDYVESSDVGDKDTYAYGNLTSTSGTVFGVQVLPYAKKTDAGTRTIASVARLSATEVDSAGKTLSSTYQYLPDIRETKPGGGAWSVSDVNSAEFGVKVTA